MYSPTNFVVSSEIGSVSTRGQHRRSATIDIQRLDQRAEAGGWLRQPLAPASEAKRAGKHYDCNTMIPVPLFDLKFLIGRNHAADQSADM
jgi:hypothetical protein